jgi:hypothetical protein
LRDRPCEARSLTEADYDAAVALGRARHR